MRKFSLLAFAAISFVQLASPASADTLTFSSNAAGSSLSNSTSWNASTGNLGPGVTCVGCGVPVVPDTYYGWDTYLSTSGSAGVTLSAAASTGALVVNTGQMASVTAQAASHGLYNLTSAYQNIAPSFTQTGAIAKSVIQSSFSFSNNLSGQVCFVACSSFGTSLGSANTSFTALGYTTAGSGSLTLLGDSFNGVNGAGVSTKYGSVKLNAPGALNGVASGGSLKTSATGAYNVASASLDLANLAAKAGGVPPLNGSYHIPGLGDISYNVLNAALTLNETLTLSTSVAMIPGWDLQFFNADGSPLALKVMDPFTGKFDATYQDYPFFTGDAQILTGGQNLKGAYGVLTTNYVLLVKQTADIDFSGDLNLSALGGSAFGAGFGPLYSQDFQLFDTDTQVYDGTTWFQSADTTQTFYFPAAVPEPATWSILILGVAMIGFAARRRRQAIAVAA